MVSNGSYKENWDTSALIIKGHEYAKLRIATAFTSPGQAKYQYEYRSDLKGIFHVLYIVEDISLKFNIIEGAITVACDCLNAIKIHGQ